MFNFYNPLGDFAPIGYWSKVKNSDASRGGYLMLNLQKDKDPRFYKEDNQNYENIDSSSEKNNEENSLFEEMIGTKETLIVEALLVKMNRSRLTLVSFYR